MLDYRQARKLGIIDLGIYHPETVAVAGQVLRPPDGHVDCDAPLRIGRHPELGLVYWCPNPPHVVGRATY